MHSTWWRCADLHQHRKLFLVSLGTSALYSLYFLIDIVVWLDQHWYGFTWAGFEARYRLLHQMLGPNPFLNSSWRASCCWSWWRCCSTWRYLCFRKRSCFCSDAYLTLLNSSFAQICFLLDHAIFLTKVLRCFLLLRTSWRTLLSEFQKRLFWLCPVISLVNA